ncbi:hypothetical protein HK101_008938 [Irineochytrium annulatum]|nr:hypothetical protein HK101_008938 [Irineochytrium annulatum]
MAEIATAANGDGTTTHSFFDKATATWTHLVVDDATREALVIDPVLDYDPITGKIGTGSADAVLKCATEKGYRIGRILETHVHADHLSSSQYIKKKLGGTTPVCIGHLITEVQKMVKETYALDHLATDGSQFDQLLKEADTFPLGNTPTKVLHTPGHTPDSSAFLIGRQIYVGDVLFLPDVGTARCDFPGGSATDLHGSITRKLLTLPADTRVFVGHDYPPDGRDAPRAFATVAEQRGGNKHVKDGHDEGEFMRWRRERDAGLGQPRLLHAALQVNADGGRLPPSDGKRRFVKVPLSGALY